MSYNPNNIEAKWQSYWEENDTFRVENDSSKPKYYILDMFPYPSGSGLHVGHPLGYIASDIYSRYKRQKGFNVLHPMGYDAFGLPAEQYAIQKGIHPAVSTNDNIAKFRKQLKLIGLSYDWSRELKTSDPKYYKWTQKIFTLLFDHYYSTAENKAKPISDLITHFQSNGTKDLAAFNGENISFTAEEWKGFSKKEKSEVLMNFRLAYRKVSYVNWCEDLGTVLANDEVINGLSERGGHPVTQRPMLQWTLRITAYAERLLSGLDTLEWSDSLKAMQENWIGKSKGMILDFEVENNSEKFQVFTTRPDTIYGATFIVLAPEHDLVSQITTPDNQENIQEYMRYASSLSDIERQQEKSVTGAFTGSFATHPITGNKLPIYISEYVLKHYGTGAIMAVPSDDARDNKFAKKFNIPIIEVIDRPEGAEIGDKLGTMINSEFLNGFQVDKAIPMAIEKLEKLNIGKARVQYRLRDANFSRQRYWGEPFPVIYDKEGIAQLLDFNDLPVELPQLDNIKPQKGKSPLSFHTEWVEEIEGYQRETDTMPGYAGSSWYFLRYMDPSNTEEMFSQEAVNYWQNVDFYIGGTEHAVGHLMYSRFWHKFLYDLNYVPTSEPFKKLVNQGMIQGTSLLLDIKRNDEIVQLHIPVSLADDQYRLSYESFIELQNSDNRFEGINASQDITWFEENGTKYTQLSTQVEKMSKRYHNVVNPDDVIEKYGCDVFRLYEMFLGPIEDSKPWDTQGIAGVSKFLSRLYGEVYDDAGNIKLEDTTPTKEELKALHTTIQKVNKDIKRLSFNTCASSFMILLNELRKLKSSNLHIYTEFTKIIAPFAPHIAEQIWHDLGHDTSVCYSNFPESEEKYLVDDQITYPICVQGKKRDEIEVSADLSKEELIDIATNLEKIEKYIDGKPIKKVIVVPGRMINIVV